MGLVWDKILPSGVVWVESGIVATWAINHSNAGIQDAKVSKQRVVANKKLGK